MKVPANLSGDRLILDYLTRVTVAGTRYLPKGSRIAFVGTTRNQIEREIGPHGTADPARVREVLARLGEPEDLVKAERARLDAELVSRQSRVAGAGGAAKAPITGPIEARPINSRWRPATRGRPTGRRPPAGQDGGPQDRSAGRRGAAGDRKRKGRLGGLLRDRPGTHPAEPEAQAPPDAAANSPAGQAPGSESGRAPGSESGQVPGGDTVGRAPGSESGQVPGGDTAGQAPGGAAGQAPGGDTAGQAPGGAAGQVPGGDTAGQAPGGAAGQAPGEADWWPWRGGGGRAPGGTGSPSPDGMGTQPLREAGTRASRSAAAAASRSAAAAGTGAHASGGTGTGASDGAETPGSAGAGTRASTAGPRAGGGEPSQQKPAGWLTPTAVIPPTAGSRPTGRAGRSGGDTPVHGIPVLPPRTRAPREPWTLRTAATALGRGAARLAVSAARLARRYPLETAAVMLLALGGLVLPFPYWLFGGLLGGLLSIRSAMWLARDKWAAVVGPVVIMIVGTVLAALFTGGRGGAVTAYPHAFVLYAGDLLRLGNVLCAAYLVVQARRAPQRRLPPWQRQRQPPPRQLR
jgi:hypothetical protein